jgi:L-ribulose-5-phosphate 3-epimerase
MTRFGYGTNGFANHRLADALSVLADLGYTGVALTLDHCHLDPYARDVLAQIVVARRLLARHHLAVVVETGARYLLDPRRKHAPTLLDDEPDRRLDYLRRAVDIGGELGAEAVSFWAGVRPADLADALAWERLVRGCAEVAAYADTRGVTLGFEPEPGMLVEDVGRWEQLFADLGRPPGFGITVDIGHLRCVEDAPEAECVRRVGPHIVNVQIDDMRRGVHEHLEFGTGEVDIPSALAALRNVGYAGLVAVELPRHSHAAPEIAARSIAYLRAATQESRGAGLEVRR